MTWFTVSIATFDRMRLLEISKQCSHIQLECVGMVPKLIGLVYGNRDDFKDCTLYKCRDVKWTQLGLIKETLYSVMINEYFDRCMTRVFAHCIRMNMPFSKFARVSVLYCPSNDDRVKAFHDLSDGQWTSIHQRALEWRRRMNTFCVTRHGRNLMAAGTRSVIANVFREFQIGESMQEIKCPVGYLNLTCYDRETMQEIKCPVSNLNLICYETERGYRFECL
jgi:hypothetical protein